MSCYCDYDPADVWDERRHRARKAHKCYECNETIDPGDDYIRISYLSEGQWGHHKMCEYCEHDWQVVRDAGHCYLVGGLAEAWEDMWQYAAPIEPDRLVSVTRGES